MESERTIKVEGQERRLPQPIETERTATVRKYVFIRLLLCLTIDAMTIGVDRSQSTT